jgi:hypothetical protein
VSPIVLMSRATCPITHASKVDAIDRFPVVARSDSRVGRRSRRLLGRLGRE